MKHALPKATARFLQVFADQSATSGSMLLQPVAPACTGWVPGAMDELNQQDKPGVLAAVTAAADQVVNTLIKYGDVLEKCMRDLKGYAESKRAGFPRFFFLSQRELLDVLANGQPPFTPLSALPCALPA